MKLIFIRHAEPRYDIDSLTDKGRREAALLAKRTASWHITQAYASVLGRAQETALPTLEEHGIHLSHRFPEPAEDVILPPDPKTCIVYPWLREFNVPIRPDMHPTGKRIGWDFTPEYLTAHPELYDINRWWTSEIYQDSPKELPTLNLLKEMDADYEKIYGLHYDVKPGVPLFRQEYDWATCRLDEVLAQWGYVREGLHYRTSGANGPSDGFIEYPDRTIACEEAHMRAMHEAGIEEPVLVFFCHLGVASVLISHLINTTPAVMHHGFFMPTTGVTVLSAEERIPGQVLFRIQTYGDTSHLREGGEPLSYYGGFDMPFMG